MRRRHGRGPRPGVVSSRTHGRARGKRAAHSQVTRSSKKEKKSHACYAYCNANACVDLTSSSNNATASKPNLLHTSSLPLREQIHNSHKNFCSQKKVLIHINFGQRVRYLILCPIKTKHKIIIARGEARAESRGCHVHGSTTGSPIYEVKI